MPLEAHAGKRILAAEIVRLHAHEERAVGVFAIAGKGAHAIGHHAARLAGRRDDIAARAHAEGVRTAPVGQAHAQLVVGCAQRRMRSRRAVLAAVDELLLVFDARADGEGLAHHGHAQRVKRLERIARAVSHSQNHAVRSHGFALSVRVLEHRAGHMAVLEDQIDQTRLEAHLAAQPHDFFAQRLDHQGEPVRADVRLAQIEDFLRRTALVERVQHAVAAGIIDASGQLAVGKRARAALAKLHVGARIERAARPEGIDAYFAPVDVLPALDDQRPCAGLSQLPRGKQTSRPQPDHQRPVREHRIAAGDVNSARLDDRGLNAVGQALDHFFLARVFERRVQRHDEMHVALVARVHALFGDAHALNAAAQIELCARQMEQRLFIIIEGNLDVIDAYHACFSPVSERAALCPASMPEAHAH